MRWADFDQDGGCCGDFGCLFGSNLLLQIMAKLDLPDLMRARCSCRSWYDAILSSQFLEIWKNKDQPICVLLAIRSEPKESLDSYLNHIWYPVSSSSEDSIELWHLSKGTLLKSSFVFPMPDLPNGSRFEGLLSSHGLVLGRLMDHEDSNRHIKLLVGNPVLNTWKFLPPPPLPPTISAYNPHHYAIERDMLAENYTTVVFLKRNEEGEEEDWDDAWFYQTVEYRSNGETWYIGPTLYDCAISDCQSLPLQGSMIGIEPLCQHAQIFCVYDHLLMAWSHLHVRFLFERLGNDDKESRGYTWSIIAGFKHEDSYFVAARFWEMPYQEALGIGVWQLNEIEAVWELLSTKFFTDLYGSRWRRPEDLTWRSNLMDINWKCQLVGDHVIFSAAYKPHTHGLVPPIAFHFNTFTWISADLSMIKDLECVYSLLPSLEAQVTS